MGQGRLKIALCLSGQPRNVQKGFERINNLILSGRDVDVFCHHWTSNKNCDKVIDLYKPKKFQLQEQLQGYGKLPDWKSVGFNVCSMFYSIMRSFKLMEEYCEQTGTSYDCVIKTRTDIGLVGVIPEIEEVGQLNDKEFFCVTRWGDVKTANDILMFGKPESMQPYFNIYDKLHQIKDAKHKGGLGGITVLRHAIEVMNIIKPKHMNPKIPSGSRRINILR